VIVADIVRDFGNEIAVNNGKFCVRTIARNAISGFYVSYFPADLPDDAGVAISQCDRSIQLGTDGFYSCGQPIGFHFLQRLFDLVRLLERLFDQVAFAEFEQHSFGSGGNQCPLGFDQHMTGSDYRCGCRNDFDLTGFQTLQYLAHTLTQSADANTLGVSRKSTVTRCFAGYVMPFE